MIRYEPENALPVEQCDLLKILAHTYLRYGQFGKAAILLYAVHSVDPGDQTVTKALAYADVNSGRPHDAMLLLDSLPESGVPGREVFFLRSIAYGRMDRPADAARSMRYFLGAKWTDIDIGRR